MQSRTPSLKRAPARSRAPPPHRGGATHRTSPVARARRVARTARDATRAETRDEGLGSAIVVVVAFAARATRDARARTASPRRIGERRAERVKANVHRPRPLSSRWMSTPTRRRARNTHEPCALWNPVWSSFPLHFTRHRIRHVRCTAL